MAKGKRVQRFDRVPEHRQEILKAAMGPSGNLRAPTFRAGNDFIIGFNPELYADWIGGQG